MPFFVTTDSCRLFYEIRGNNDSLPILVFLNGTMQTTLSWLMIIRDFEKQFRILLYDARAQGQSDQGNEKLTLERHSSDLGALLVHLNIPRVNLVGISHGAAVALAFSALFPDKVDKLVLCSAGAETPDHTRRLLGSWVDTLRRDGLEPMVRKAFPVVFGDRFLTRYKGYLEEMMAAVIGRNRRDHLIAHLTAMNDYQDLSFYGKRSTAPFLVISASNDPLVSKKNARDLASLCGGKHEYIQRTGHSIPFDAPEKFISIVLDFLTQGNACG